MIAGHWVLGAAVYKAVMDKPLWVRIPLLASAGFTTHWVLDSVIAYHSCSFNTWYDGIILAINALSIILLSCYTLVAWGWKGIYSLLSGMYFWFCWDWEHILGNKTFLHLNHHPVLARYFPDHSMNPWSVVLELMFVVTFMLIAIPGKEGVCESK